MKILVVAHDANFVGGANRSLFTNLVELRDRYNVEFLVLTPSAKGQLNQKLDSVSIPWISCKYFGVTSGLRHDGKDILRRLKVKLGYYIEKFQAKRVARKVKNQNIDLVYTNTRLPMIGANIASLLNIPHVVHVRELGAEEPMWGKWDFKRMYDMSDKIILISNALKEQFLAHVPEDKLVVSHNGIQYSTVEFKYNNLSNEVNLIITGRLVPDKGHEDALLALNHIITNSLLAEKNIKLHIVGSSPKQMHIEWYEHKLRKMVTELSLNDYVIFEGESNDMPGMRSKMDIELVCSISETFGRVTVEGMRSALFVIGSNTGGTPEIIADGYNGYLYKQGDPIDLAHKIVDACSDVERFNLIRKNALDFSKNNFTVEKNCNDIYSVFTEVMDKN